MLNHTSPDNVRIHLYTNNRTPSGSDVLSNYTESTAAGYASASLTGSSWTVSTTLGTTSAVYATRTFTFTTTDTIYGMYATNNASSQLLWAESFDSGPYNLPSGGGTIDLDPVLRLRGG